MQEKFKTLAIIVLVGLLAFALGRLSAVYGNRGELKIEYPAAQSAATIVASRTGSKYFLPWCGSAQSIKEENRVYFATAADAEAAGYSPARNCKGL